MPVVPTSLLRPNGPPSRRRERAPRAGAATPGLLLALAATLGCSSGGGGDSPVERVLARVEVDRLRAHVDTLADDALEGRRPGSAGHLRARDYLTVAMAEAAIEPAGDGGSYVHAYPTVQEPEYLFPYTTGHDLVGIHRGRDPELADEMVVVMAHYDGLGRTALGAILNGAYDDAAGVAVLIELARAMREADYAPRRSVVFLLTDEEESNSNGAYRWALEPSVGRHEDVVFGVSVDPVGRPTIPGYAWTAILGLERSPELETKVRAAHAGWGREDVVLLHRDAIPPLLNSDQDWFHLAGIPAAWFTNPGFSYYHTIRDDPETVDYRVVIESARVLMDLVDLVANDDERYPYRSAPPITPERILPIRKVYRHLVGRGDVLSAAEIAYARDVLDGLDAIEARGRVEESDDPLFLQGILGIFAFSVLHPGPIPPPLP